MKTPLHKYVTSILMGLCILSALTLSLCSADSHACVTAEGTANLYAIVLVHDLPPEARKTLDSIKTGGPFPYRRDGSVFGNREHFLPSRYHGYYTEYTVLKPGSPDRGARRIIAGAGKERNPRLSGEYYYTDDHYQSFKKIIER